MTTVAQLLYYQGILRGIFLREFIEGFSYSYSHSAAHAPLSSAGTVSKSELMAGTGKV